MWNGNYKKKKKEIYFKELSHIWWSWQVWNPQSKQAGGLEVQGRVDVAVLSWELRQGFYVAVLWQETSVFTVKSFCWLDEAYDTHILELHWLCSKSTDFKVNHI